MGDETERVGNIFPELQLSNVAEFSWISTDLLVGGVKKDLQEHRALQ
jgi:hypothetical protein